jgi:selenocysteine lyase/cysteine desulfurase
VDGRDPAELVDALRARGVNTSAQTRVSAVIDYDDKGVAATLRLSPHYYNTEEEIDQGVTILRDILQK